MGKRVSLADKVAFLCDPRSYPQRTPHVETVETHFAWIFLTAEHAYKLKKPLRHAQMDYRSLDAREQGCRDELRLNRRLAPTVYLSVVPLCLRDGALVLGRSDRVSGRDHVVDWLVRMRRLSARQMLDRALAEGRIGKREIGRVVDVLMPFFERAQPTPFEPAAYAARCERRIANNHRAFRKHRARLPDSLVEQVRAAQRAFVADARDVLAGRGTCVVEGHGDLRAEHVHLGPTVSVIDCLEFDRDLRLLDPAEEIALLALEITRLGYGKLADELACQFFSACRTPPHVAVFRFYQSHTATTRAKLAVWHLDDPQFPDARPWLARARSLLTDALKYAQDAIGLLQTQRSFRAPRRPALQQRNERRAAHHARERFAKERSNRKNRKPALI